MLPEPAAARRRWPGLAAVLALVAVLWAGYQYATGEAATLPVQLVPHLAPVPVVLDSVAVGPAHLPLPINGFITTLTHDVGGPYTRPTAAGLWLAALALALAGWLAVVSTLRRPAFLAGMGLVLLLLLSLNLDGLGVFDSTKQYLLGLALGVLGAAALGLQLVGEAVALRWRVVLFGGLLAGLAGLIALKSTLPPTETLLHLAAYGTPASAVLVGGLVAWVGFENMRALLWFNTQAEQPASRFGRLPFILASGLYLGVLGLYYWNGEVALGGGLHLDPLALLLPAVLAGGLGLRQRAPSFGAWVPLAAARPLYWLLVTAAAASLGYALATANAPLLAAARNLSVLALGLLGAAFLLYVLVNFGDLIQQRLRVYRVVFEPRRLPFYTVYVLGLGALGLLELRDNWPLLDQVRAGQYNQFGDLARQQSEARPDDLPLALLAERYYAESGDVLDRFNRSAQLGRAALYRFRTQRQNELNALRRALLRQPDEKVSVRLAAMLTEPADFFNGLEALRQGRRAAPRSFPLTSDQAQLFTHSALTDSVARYLDRAERLAPGSYVSRTNQLGFLLSQGLYPAAQRLVLDAKQPPAEPALVANAQLLRLLARTRAYLPTQLTDTNLDAAAFAEVYHTALHTVQLGPTSDCIRLAALVNTLAARPANAAYYEQLVYLQALLQHAAGQEVAARRTLAPLAAGISPTAGYYQYVLGLWQLQQQQYATAASQLALAARHGATEARPARAWALALGGQPDSAVALARRLTAADSAQRPVGQRLLAALAAAKTATPVASTGLVGHQLLLAAQQAEARPPLAARFYRQVVATAPFYEGAMLAAARFYAAQHQPSEAYETLRLALLENPDSAPLLQAYTLAAADAGLADLAQPALEQLRPHLSPAAYANLLAQVAARRAAHAAAVASFDQSPAPGR